MAWKLPEQSPGYKDEASTPARLMRKRMKELGMTQKELAERVGRERTYINRIERGETDLQLSSFIRIAEALGIIIRLDVNLA